MAKNVGLPQGQDPSLVDAQKKAFLLQVQADLGSIRADIVEVAKAVGVSEEYALNLLMHRELVGLNQQLIRVQILLERPQKKKNSS